MSCPSLNGPGSKRTSRKLNGAALGGAAGLIWGSALVATTAENLAASAAGERHEHTEIYPGFAEVAKKEGFDVAAALWTAISIAEKQHEKRYSDLAANVDAGRVFKREKKTVWRCLNCGYLHEGPEAPGQCPACAHPQAYFELLGENW